MSCPDVNSGNTESKPQAPASLQTLVWPSSNCGMDLRLQFSALDAAFATGMRNRIEQALEGREAEAQAPAHDCLILKNVPGAADAYLKQSGTEAVAPLALLVGGDGMEAGLPPRMAWVPEDCDPCVLAWMLDHLSANAWSWSGRQERRRELRASLLLELTPKLTLVDISLDGCQLESTEPFAPQSTVDVPLNALLPNVTLQLKLVRTRPVKEGKAFRVHGYFATPPADVRQALQDALSSSLAVHSA